MHRAVDGQRSVWASENILPPRDAVELASHFLFGRADFRRHRAGVVLDFSDGLSRYFYVRVNGFWSEMWLRSVRVVRPVARVMTSASVSGCAVEGLDADVAVFDAGCR